MKAATDPKSYHEIALTPFVALSSDGMGELDDLWSQMLAEASDRARASGRRDVADYLDLKASNDLIRQTGVRWLFDTLVEAVAYANRNASPVAIERTEPHTFRYAGASLAGSMVNFRYGVRCLTVEAGWTRTPADGFMRGGSLALARFSHFGIPKAGVELALFKPGEVPVWKKFSEGQAIEEIGAEYLAAHIALLTDA